MPSWAKWGLSLLVALSLVWVGWRFSAILVTLHILVCFVLVIVIMLQSGSAADLAGAFGGAGSQTAFGPRGAATFLSRATTWCAIVFMMTSLALSVKRDSRPESARARFSSRPNSPRQRQPSRRKRRPRSRLLLWRPRQHPRRRRLQRNRGFCYNLLALGIAVVAELADAPA